MTIPTRILLALLCLLAISQIPFQALAIESVPSSSERFYDMLIVTKENNPGWMLNAYPSFAPNSSLLSRVQQAPAELLASAGKEDQRIYTSYNLSDEERAQFEHSLTLLPKAFLKPLRENLLGFYFINDFKTSGWAHWILDENSLDIKFIIMLHPKVLKMSLSEWLTDKENSAFLPDQNGLKVNINAGHSLTGLTGILIHECAHIFDYVHHVTPCLERLAYDIIKIKSPELIKEYQKYGTPFLQNVWPKNQDDLAPQFKKLIPKRPIFYAVEKKKLPLKVGLKLHRKMHQMPYSSLYSLIGWGEDYAEMALFHQITQVLKQPYGIEFSRKDQLIFKSYPMEHPLVRARFPIIENYHQYPNAIPTPTKLPLDKICGEYERVLPSNAFHHVTINLNNDESLQWTNRANVSWQINIIKNSLSSGKDHPYQNNVTQGEAPPVFLDYHMDWRQPETGEIKLCAIHHLGEWYMRL
jgi:hypothetical protein